MMTKIKFMGLAALLTVSMSMIAQDKLFTLEDLNYGGTNYRRMLPKNMLKREAPSPRIRVGQRCLRSTRLMPP